MTGGDTTEWAKTFALDISCSTVRHFPVTGQPHAGEVHPYRGGVAVDVDLGEYLASGYGPDRPHLTVTTPAECLALFNAFLDAYAKLTVAGAS